MDNRVAIELADEEVTMRVTPEFIHKYIKCIDGDAYLDYEDGEEPIRLFNSFEDIMISATKLEQAKRDKRNRG